MNKKAFAVGVGGVLAGVLAFLAANFTLTAKTSIGEGILALLAYIVAAIVHVPDAQGRSGMKKFFHA